VPTGSANISAPIIAYNRCQSDMGSGGYYYGSACPTTVAVLRGANVFDGGRLPYVCGLYGYC